MSEGESLPERLPPQVRELLDLLYEAYPGEVCFTDLSEPLQGAAKWCMEGEPQRNWLYVRNVTFDLPELPAAPEGKTDGVLCFGTPPWIMLSPAGRKRLRQDRLWDVDPPHAAVADSDRQDQQTEATGESGGQPEGTEAGDDDLERICVPLTALEVRIIQSLWNQERGVTFDDLRDEAWRGKEVLNSSMVRRLKDIRKRWAMADILDFDLDISEAKERVILTQSG